MKKLLLSIWLIVIVLGIAALFWYHEYRYALPTPIPASYQPVKNGTEIYLPKNFATTGRPVFVHFFNPDCPCSRFNLAHFRSLVSQFHNQVDFAVVVLNNTRYAENDIQAKLGVELPVSFDTSLAVACGVYSTPQAVILDDHHHLYYRGNYNRSRYCSDPATNYAQTALEALLRQRPAVAFDHYALTAYGCQLPQCTK